MLCYCCFLRPKEICELKLKDIERKEMLLTVPSDVAKNGKERIIALPSSLTPFFKRLDYSNVNNYIFSDNWMPGKKMKNTRDVGRRWTYS